MLTTIPTISAVMAIFTHAQEGPDRTVGIMRGMTHGLLGSPRSWPRSAPRWFSSGFVASFSLALAVVVVVQASSCGRPFKLHDETGTIDDVLLEVAD